MKKSIMYFPLLVLFSSCFSLKTVEEKELYVTSEPVLIYSETIKTEEGVDLLVSLQGLKKINGDLTIYHGFSYFITNTDQTKTFNGYIKNPKTKRAYLHITFILSDGSKMAYKNPMSNIMAHSIFLEVSPLMRSPEISFLVTLSENVSITGVDEVRIKYETDAISSSMH